MRATLDVLSASDVPMSTQALETRVELSRSRLETMLKVLDVDGAVRRVRGGWTSTGQPWTYDADRYAKVTRVRKDEQRAMLDYLATSGCRMRYLREQLDDPQVADCGRCDNCGGLELSAAITQRTVSDATAKLNRPGVTVDPRRMWPAAMPTLGVDLKGKIASDEQAEAGRAVARFTDLGYGQRIRALLSDTVADAEPPAELVAAAVEVLSAWQWEQRPTAVVHIGSHRRPTLSATWRARSAQSAGYRIWAASPITGEATGRSNSAQRLRARARRVRAS